MARQFTYGRRRVGEARWYRSPYRFPYMFRHYRPGHAPAYTARMARRFGFKPAPPKFGWVW